MSCRELQARLQAYVDGELPVGETAAADGHVAECWVCAERVARERQFRELLRRQPRETAPPELRGRIVAALGRRRRSAALRRLLVPPAVAALAAALLVAVLLPGLRSPAPLVADLVDKHIAYAQLEWPAELVSTDGAEIEAWFRQRAGLQVTVPDYSPAGIRLVGARLADAQQRQAAYLLYEKGRILLSVFMVPVALRERDLPGTRVVYEGREYAMVDRQGYRTVAWTDGPAVFGLVSMLDDEALLECAARLRAERAARTQL